MTRWTGLGLLAATVSLAPGLAGAAWAQSASDFIAYPRTLTDVGNYRTNTRQLTFNRMPGLSPDYRLGAGDVLQITIVGHEPLERKINASGEITVPLAGPVKLADLTAEEAEAAIATLLREKQLIDSPQVLLFVSDYQAKTIYALGEIDRPGEYSVSFQMTLMDLIFIAGGMDFTAGRYGYLHRRVAGAPPDWRPQFAKGDIDALAGAPDVPRAGSEVIRIDLQPMREGGVLERNIVLRNGDVFYVPKRKMEFAYVIGDVNTPGAYELPGTTRVTAVQAISWAGGPTRTARMGKGILVRNEPDGKRREFPVDFAAVLRGRQPDVEVRPNDIIFVPGSAGKTVGQGLLSSIPNVATYLLIF